MDKEIKDLLNKLWLECHNSEKNFLTLKKLRNSVSLVTLEIEKLENKFEITWLKKYVKLVTSISNGVINLKTEDGLKNFDDAFRNIINKLFPNEKHE